MYNNNIPQYRQNMQNINHQNKNGDRFIGGGFFGPFILGGITGGLLANSSKSIFAKSSIVLHFLKSIGVVLFTLSSVHWAESITATSKSKGLVKSKLHFASGYDFFNISVI